MKSIIRGTSAENIWTYEDAFHWFSEPRRLGKLCAHYELYKRIINIPGDVIELGVFRGASLIRWVTFRDMLETNYSRQIYGFDIFGNFPKEGIRSSIDQKEIEAFETLCGKALSIEELQSIFEQKGLDEHLHLIKGDIRETLPALFEKQPGMRLSFVHLDVDVYEPTITVLENCWNRMVPGGLMLFDDYSFWEGATRAFDEFFQNQKISIQKLPIAHTPAFIIK
ncbi:MAG: TylF/MycF family methyltransferase [Planctomycetaceae bacterium]|jgi:hypothetical protein|nr:TylF/MycF family methyltransferase [Planctomycetaceae bacterium]